MFNHIYKGLKVFVTGHTGFKGSWLSLWLKNLGADVVGYSLEPKDGPNLFELACLQDKVVHITADIRDYDTLKNSLLFHKPDLVFHLAAQPLVLESYEDPRGTFETNVSGTVNLLEAIRQTKSVKGCLVVTTDKCYENQNWVFGYRENDRLGGSCPYSTSKAMAELAVASYRRSFKEEMGCGLATARAGNVIGGGDFSEFRIVPDIMKALMKMEPVCVRNPRSVRPWLHVLEPLYGYLLLGQRLLEEQNTFDRAWNFGPQENDGVTVKDLVEHSISLWGEGDWYQADVPLKPEMNMLRLNWDLAANLLKWRPVYSWKGALQETVSWFKACQNQEDMYDVCCMQIENYNTVLCEETCVSTKHS